MAKNKSNKKNGNQSNVDKGIPQKDTKAPEVKESGAKTQPDDSTITKESPKAPVYENTAAEEKISAEKQGGQEKDTKAPEVKESGAKTQPGDSTTTKESPKAPIYENTAAEEKVGAKQQDGNEKKTRKLSFLEKIGKYLASNLFQRLESEKSDLDAKNKLQQEQLANERKEVQRLQVSNQSLERSFEDARKSNGERENIIENQQNEIDSQKGQIADLERRLRSLQQDLENQQEVAKEVEQQIANEAKDSVDIQNQILSKILRRFDLVFKNIPAPKKIDDALYKIVETIEDGKRKIKEAEESVGIAKSDARRKQEQMQSIQAQAIETKRLAETELEEAKKLKEEVESSDMGKLHAQLADSNATIDTLRSEASVANQKIENLKQDLARKEQGCAELRTELQNEKDLRKQDLEAKDAKIKEMQETHRNVMNKKVEEHKTECKALEQKREEEVRNLKGQHRTEIEDIKSMHEEEIARLASEHKAAEENIKQTYESKMSEERQLAKQKEDALNSTINSHVESISKLENTLKAEGSAIRQEVVATVNSLHSFIQGHEILLACNDEYQVKAEDKNLDLVDDSKQLAQEIAGLPEVAKPSEWVNVLRQYLMKQIEENASFINRLFKYYTMSGCVNSTVSIAISQV